MLLEELGGSTSLTRMFFMEYQTHYSGHFHVITEILYKRKTKFQEVLVAKIPDLGVALIIDGKIQSTTKDEYIYHETLVHPILFSHPRPQNILIIGGGEGATAREALKHDPVKVDMVDIDETVLNLVKKYMPTLCRNVFNDKRLNLVIKDGRRFIESLQTGIYDAIIIDVTDPLPTSSSYRLYTKEFYHAVASALKEDGLMVTQATSTYYSRDFFFSVIKTLREEFPIVSPFATWVPSYGSLWGFVIGSKRYDPITLTDRLIEERINERGVDDLEYYSSTFHKALFVLPYDLSSKIISGQGDIITDDSPKYVPI